ncbi:hypothetical protein SMACR_05924 [Sordaria macrospora]|uniref:asparagine--tRNA ligase n=3 Tax=Sordaria macrospora TaxID=5147 RepID=F7W3I4_SORMK|nr:uncharacterized protein SMAC_05924 [Sordaria macrospora k-hell]KAA8634289.1 hypothetical protein SMACR_05924 [Sordaria macrospora]KAH7627934.1 hypothetical protein B0T09DRAFT_268700 [Sordaria sp. MPI-SDFR-AT-0083]CCC12186.1 unnamed protein product [Sordaria macrospora k-hell]
MGMGMGKSIFTSTPSSSTLRATRGMRSTVLARHLPQQPPLGKDLDQGHISRRTISSSSPRRVKNWDLKELERLVKESKEQLRKLEDEAGKPLKRTTALHMSIAECLRWKPESEEDNVVVQGYIRSVRGMKTHRFVSLGDGSSLAPLQAVVPVDTNQAEGLAIGAAVRLTGKWVASPGASQSHEMQVTHVDILGPSDAKTFPIQKKYQTPEYLRTIPHLRPRTPINAALLKMRSEAVAALTRFFADHDFTQTHPPILTSSDCEGAGEVFTVAPASNIAELTDEDNKSKMFFRNKKYLTVSTQLHLEALAQSVGNVWTLSPVFRAEKSDTARHLSEFYMLEAEMSFVNDLDEVMDLAEDMIRNMCITMYESHTVHEFLNREGRVGSDLVSPEEVNARWEGMMAAEWPRLTYTDAIEFLQEHADKFEHKPVWTEGLHSEHEKFIAEQIGDGKPVFVTHYPRDIKAFYMREGQSIPDDTCPGPTVECFDLLVPDLCEIAGGSMREHRLEPLLEAMKRHNIVAGEFTSSMDGDAPTGGAKAGPLDWYVDLRRWGCAPHGGFGIGFDRLLCYLTGVQTIRDMVSFPRWVGRCDC